MQWYHARTIFFETKFEMVYFFMRCTDSNDSIYKGTDKILGFHFLAEQTDIRLRLQNFLSEPMKVAEIFGVLFASCSNAPKLGRKCDEFKSLYQTHSQTAILWTYQSPSKKNNTTSNSTSHGQEVRNLVKASYWQCTCPSPSAHLLGTFGHGNISIPLLRAQTL